MAEAARKKGSKGATYTRLYGTRLLNPERCTADFSRIINEILQPFAGMDGTRASKSGRSHGV
jgi:hypothetical protein